MVEKFTASAPLASKPEEAAHKMLAETNQQKPGHVTGIGGVFFKSHGDPKVLNDWYEKNLDIPMMQTPVETLGIVSWKGDKGADGGVTVWQPS